VGTPQKGMEIIKVVRHWLDGICFLCVLPFPLCASSVCFLSIFFLKREIGGDFVRERRKEREGEKERQRE
jgi:hypothetical protein